MASPNLPIFKPPAGLQAHERVVWAGQDHSRIPARGLALIATVFGGLPFLYSLLNGTVTFTPSRIWGTWEMLSLVVLASTIPFIAVSRQALKTRYYLTTYRLVKAEHGKIVQEISKSIFKGKAVGQFLKKTVVSKRGRKINLTVVDPDSGGQMMNLGALKPSSIGLFESYIGEVHCEQCGVQNDRSSTSCSGCGASL